MTGHDIQIDDERAAGDEAASDEGASFLRKHIAGGTVAYAVGGLSLVRALRALGRNPRRAAFHGALGAAAVALGTVQRRRYGGGADESAGPSLDDGHEIPFEDEAGDEAVGEQESEMEEGEPPDKTTEELSSPTPGEARRDDDIPNTQVANEPAEATGPSSTDSVPEQTDPSEPEATPEDDPEVEEEEPSIEGKDERTTPGEKADTPEEEIAEETGDGSDDEAGEADEEGVEAEADEDGDEDST